MERVPSDGDRSAPYGPSDDERGRRRGGRPSGRRRPGAHDRRRLRASYGTALAGLLLGVLGAVAVGLLGASGRAGAAVLLVLTAAGCVLAALVTAALAMIDEYRRHPVSRARTLMALWFFLGGALLLIMSTGVSSGTAG